MSWRTQCTQIISTCLSGCKAKGSTEKEIRAALRAAYPWHERKYWPYKVWLDEIRRQRGLPHGIDRKRNRKTIGRVTTHNLSLEEKTLPFDAV